MYEVSLLINGADKAAENNATFDRLDPVSGDVATRSAAASVADAVAAVEAAHAAFPAWSKVGPNARRAILNKAAGIVRAKAPEFAERVSAETGSTKGWGMFNVMFAAGLLEEAAAMTTQISGEVIPSDHGAFAMAVRQPAGVCLGMAPWNAPIILGMRAIAMPIACGNTAVLKASETCPATHRLIADCFAEAGLPEGVLNVVTHSAKDAGPVVEAMIAHPHVRRVNFTGSTKVGRIIGRLAGENLKPVVLELGGKAPLVVLDDADLDAAVAGAAFGAFMHQGQICMSTERIIVDASIADAFVAKFKTKVETLKAGDPKTTECPLGAVVDMATIERVNRLIEDAVAKGATIVTGGPGTGVVMQPTIVDNVKPGMAIYGEESFGPAVSVIRVNGVDEAVASANDTEYGLSAAVFGKDVGRALQVAQRIESGICHVNGPTVQDEAQMPFGGEKASGVGRFGGKYGVHEFTDLRWITIQQAPRHYPI